MFSIIFLLYFHLIVVNCDSKPIVRTRYGPIKGLSGSYNINGLNYDYSAFLGIPFAKPPLRTLRFQRPVAFNSTWMEPYDATYFRDGCVQKQSRDSNFNKSEDCLYLNIWKPVANDSDQLLPVYYLIHGSGYVVDSGASLNNQGDVLAATQNIIVVNSNYRLGVFGWAFGSPDKMPGNVGLYDTLLVLQWIQDNIKSFGGDPNRVTLTGLSAGSKIVSIIASTSNTRYLYSRLIMMSGVAVNQVHIESPDVGVSKTKLLASKVNCLSKYDKLISSIGDKLSAETVNCLMKVPANDLLKAQNLKEINAIGASEISVFLPVYGTSLITDPPMINHKTHLDNNQQVSMLFGSEQDEASMFQSVEEVTTIQEAYDYTKERISFALKNITKEQFEKVFKIYFNETNPTNYFDIRSSCVQFCSDMNYNCPSLFLSQFYSQVSDKIYYYKNTYSGKKLSRPYGTKHGDDQLIAQGDPYRQFDKYTSEDRQFSSIMMKIFGDFTKGIPLNGWPTIKLDTNAINSLQLIREMSLIPRNIVQNDQQTCLEWAKLFNYLIAK